MNPMDLISPALVSGAVEGLLAGGSKAAAQFMAWVETQLGSPKGSARRGRKVAVDLQAWMESSTVEEREGLLALWEPVQAELDAASSSNVVVGSTVGKLVQARDISGGVSM